MKEKADTGAEMSNGDLDGLISESLAAQIITTTGTGSSNIVIEVTDNLRQADPDAGNEVEMEPVELSTDALTDGRTFDALAAGKFTDMGGRAVKFDLDELQAYLDNTIAAIEATRAESGELVGLPIDARGHEKGDGAGWIVGAELQGDKIRFTPRWTEIGRELISKGIRRFFSATVDTVNKVILGGTLTNWPATRDKSGRVLLRPVELQIQIRKEANVTDTITIAEDQLRELIDGRVAEALKDAKPATPAPVADLAALLGPGLSEEAKAQRVAELQAQMETYRKQAELEFRAEMARLQHAQKMTELAQTLTGGTDAAPRGLRVAAEELQAHLLKLEPDEAKFWGDLLGKTQKDGFIEFGEVGHGHDPKGGSKSLPAEYAKMLDAGTLTIADLAAPQAGLGDLDQYDLSKWRKQ
jgi:hypothetical protein